MFSYLVDDAISYYNNEVFELMEDYNWYILNPSDLSEWLKSRIGYGFSTNGLINLILDELEDADYNITVSDYDIVAAKATDNINELYDRIFG